MMSLRGVVAAVVLLALVLTPVLGLAADDLSGAARATGLRHQPSGAWRTVPGAVEPYVAMPRIVALATLEVWEPAHAQPLVIRMPFVPPRG